MWCNHNNPTIKQSQTIAVQGRKSCLKLTTLNLNHSKTVEDMELKIWHWGPLEWHYLPTKYHENLPSGSKVISRGHTDTHIYTQTDRQTGDLIRLLSFLQSRLIYLVTTQQISIICIFSDCYMNIVLQSFSPIFRIPSVYFKASWL
jgi:hypothetical protein